MFNGKQLGAVAVAELEALAGKQIPEESASLAVYFGLLLSSVHRCFLVQSLPWPGGGILCLEREERRSRCCRCSLADPPGVPGLQSRVSRAGSVLCAPGLPAGRCAVLLQEPEPFMASGTPKEGLSSCKSCACGSPQCHSLVTSLEESWLLMSCWDLNQTSALPPQCRGSLKSSFN